MGFLTAIVQKFLNAMMVIDIFRVIVFIAKFSVLISFFFYFKSFLPELSNLLKTTMDNALEPLGLLDGLDLHCIAGLIGLDVFLNALLNMVLIAGTFYISAIASILVIKYTVMLFGFAMRL